MTLNPNHLTSSEYFELIKNSAYSGYRINIPLPDSLGTLIALQHHVKEWYVFKQYLFFRGILSDIEWKHIEKVYDTLYTHIYSHGQSEYESECEWVTL